jgi:hypothetical protein
MLDKFEGIRDSFSFDLCLSSSSSDGITDGSHGGRFLNRKTFVGHLDMVGVVIDALFRFLGQVGKICASSLGGIFWFIGFKEFCLNSIPVVGGDSIFGKAFEPSNSLISETHLEFQKLVIIVPVSDGAGIVNTDDEQSSGDGVLATLAIVERYIR